MNESRIVNETSLKDVLEIGMARDMERVGVSVRQAEDYTLVADAKILVLRVKWIKMALYTLDLLGYNSKSLTLKTESGDPEASEVSGYQPIVPEEGC